MGAATVVQLGELMMILDLHRQGLSVTAIARRTGRDPKTIRKYIARGLELPVYGPRQVGRPNKLAPYLDYLRERIAAFPDLSAVRLTRELRERGYLGAYTAVKRFVAAIRPSEGPKPFEVRFETPAGHQAQVDFARFVVTFEDEPGMTRIIWLFSLVLGHSRHIVARFVLHQDLQTLLRCHMRAFEAIGGVPIEILYDRMKTAVTGEDDEGHIVYNRSLIALAKHFGFLPRARRSSKECHHRGSQASEYQPLVLPRIRISPLYVGINLQGLGQVTVENDLLVCPLLRRLRCPPVLGQGRRQEPSPSTSAG